MRWNNLPIFLDICRAASLDDKSNSVILYVEGDGGTGKTSGMKSYGWEREFGVRIKNLAQDEPADLHGNPYADAKAGRTRYLLPEDLPTGDLTRLGVLIRLCKAADINFEGLFGYDSVTEIAKRAGKNAGRKMAVKAAERALYTELTDENGLTGIKRLFLAASEDEFADSEALMVEWERVQGRMEEGVLFLDELNRALPDTLQATFPLLAEGRIGTYILPAGWTIAVAGNYADSEEYEAGRFQDRAYTDRFVFIDWQVDADYRQDWNMWLAEKYGSFATKAISCCAGSIERLSGSLGGRPTQAKPSPRSWQKLVALEKALTLVPEANNKITESGEDTIFDALVRGVVGIDCASAYREAGMNPSPQEIIKDGVAPHRTALSRIGGDRGRLLGLAAGIIAEVGASIHTDKQVQTHCIEYAEWVEANVSENKDSLVSFLKSLMDLDAVEAKKNGSAGAGDMNRQAIFNPAIGNLVKNMRAKRNVRSGDFVERLLERESLTEAVGVLVGRKSKAKGKVSKAK